LTSRNKCDAYEEEKKGGRRGRRRRRRRKRKNSVEAIAGVLHLRDQ
jgi:hypothetical protein